MSKYKNFMNSVSFMSPKKSVFDLTHDAKISCNMGQLVPSCFFDCVPGDKIKVDTEALIRLLPLTAPMYHRARVSFHTWFVPYRILWENWSDYITQKTELPPVFPYITVNQNGSNYTKLMDYFGIPDPTPIVTTNKNNEQISAMRFAAYQCVYDRRYRNQRLVNEIEWKLQDGDNSANTDLTALRLRMWGSDYFTSCTPEPQYGDPVDLPITLSDAPVNRNVDPALTVPANVPTTLLPSQPNTPIQGDELWIDSKLSTAPIGIVGPENLYTDNSLTTGNTTINDFRMATVLQQYKERLMVGGSRLVEWIKAFFGVRLPDYTAQEPQYIGGSVTPLQISEVLNTTGVDGELPQGNMSGRAIGVNEGVSNYYTCQEHGVCLTIMSIMPETAYQNGIEREYSKIVSPHDFLNPIFAGLGEQAIKYREIFAFGINGAAGTTTEDTFGYNAQYAEYRTIPNRVAGMFRNQLNNWHMSRDFSSDIVPAPTPMLNADFVTSDPTHRVFADTDPDFDKVLVHVINKVRAVRPLPMYGTPGLYRI